MLKSKKLRAGFELLMSVDTRQYLTLYGTNAIELATIGRNWFAAGLCLLKQAIARLMPLGERITRSAAQNEGDLTANFYNFFRLGIGTFFQRRCDAGLVCHFEDTAAAVQNTFKLL